MMYRFGTLVVALAFFLVGCSDSLVDSQSAAPENSQRPAELPTIVEIALESANSVDSPEFTNLVAALTRVDTEVGAGLVETLNGNRQFTVFAPTDAAFDAAGQALGFDDGADLVANVPVDILAAVLTYHVAPGNRPAEDVLESERIRTLNRAFLFPQVEGEGDDIEAYLMDTDEVLGAGSPDAQIIIPDVFASNGVIHVIDWVLLP